MVVVDENRNIVCIYMQLQVIETCVNMKYTKSFYLQR